VIAADEAFCYVTTTGRRTGRTHRIEIWFGAEPGGDTLYLLSGAMDDADWVRNLRATPDTTVEVGGTVLPARARFELHPGEEARARHLLDAKYPGYSDWAARALVVALDADER
jgi:deazaflavin-dependent oxidoreductase (nitroreductase family)